jgi:hypothetical protein
LTSASGYYKLSEVSSFLFKFFGVSKCVDTLQNSNQLFLMRDEIMSNLNESAKKAITDKSEIQTQLRNRENIANSLGKLKKEIIAKKAAIDELEIQIQQSEAMEDDAWKSISKKILEGETFGDDISDFVIVKYGRPFPEIIEKFNAMNQMFPGKLGQFFMVVHNKKHQGCSNNGESGFSIKEEYIIGVITGEKLEFDLIGQNFLFPSDSKCATLSAGKFKLHQKNAAELLEDHANGHNNNEKLRIIVGDNEVIECIRERKNTSQFCRSSIFLEKSLDSFPDLRACLVGMQVGKTKELYTSLAQCFHLKTKKTYLGGGLGEDEQKLLTTLGGRICVFAEELKALGVDVYAVLLPLLIEKISLECEDILLGANNLGRLECLTELEVVNKKMFPIPRAMKN